MYLYDLFPTICDFAQAPTPKVVEGRSLAPILRGEATDVRPYLFTAYRDWQRMVRDRRWKLIEYVVGDDHHTQLFDLMTDPDELNNLAEQDSSAEVLGQLRGKLRELAKEFDDPDAAVFSAAIDAAIRPAR